MLRIEGKGLRVLLYLFFASTALVNCQSAKWMTCQSGNCVDGNGEYVVYADDGINSIFVGQFRKVEIISPVDNKTILYQGQPVAGILKCSTGGHFKVKFEADGTATGHGILCFGYNHFEGTIENGLASGRATLREMASDGGILNTLSTEFTDGMARSAIVTWRNGDVFEGEIAYRLELPPVISVGYWSMQWQIQRAYLGRGKVRFHNGTICAGNFAHAENHGIADMVCVSKSGVTWKGPLRFDHKSTYSAGIIFETGFVAIGELSEKPDSRYVGEVKVGSAELVMKHGQGKLYAKSGDSPLEGFWLDNKLVGQVYPCTVAVREFTVREECVQVYYTNTGQSERQCQMKGRSDGDVQVNGGTYPLNKYIVDALVPFSAKPTILQGVCTVSDDAFSRRALPLRKWPD